MYFLLQEQIVDREEERDDVERQLTLLRTVVREKDEMARTARMQMDEVTTLV